MGKYCKIEVSELDCKYMLNMKGADMTLVIKASEKTSYAEKLCGNVVRGRRTHLYSDAL